MAEGASVWLNTEEASRRLERVGRYTGPGRLAVSSAVFDDLRVANQAVATTRALLAVLEALRVLAIAVGGPANIRLGASLTQLLERSEFEDKYVLSQINTIHALASFLKDHRQTIDQLIASGADDPPIQASVDAAASAITAAAADRELAALEQVIAQVSAELASRSPGTPGGGSGPARRLRTYAEWQYGTRRALPPRPFDPPGVPPREVVPRPASLGGRGPAGPQGPRGPRGASGPAGGGAADTSACCARLSLAVDELELRMDEVELAIWAEFAVLEVLADLLRRLAAEMPDSAATHAARGVGAVLAGTSGGLWLAEARLQGSALSTGAAATTLAAGLIAMYLEVGSALADAGVHQLETYADRVKQEMEDVAEGRATPEEAIERLRALLNSWNERQREQRPTAPPSKRTSAVPSELVRPPALAASHPSQRLGDIVTRQILQTMTDRGLPVSSQQFDDQVLRLSSRWFRNVSS